MGNGSSASTVADNDIFDPRRYQRGVPYDAYAWLREHEPVSWHPEPETLGWPAGPGFWAVVAHADVAHVSRTPELFSAHVGATQVRDPAPDDLPFIQRMMLNMDPPDHTRLRRLVGRGFTPRRIRAMEATIHRHAVATVDAVIERGSCDLAEDIGADFPLLTLVDIMGVPAADRHLLMEWTNRVIGYQDDEFAAAPIDPDTGEPLNPRSPKALADMFAYAHDLADEKRRQPADDLLSTLAQPDDDGERLSDAEFEMMFFLFTVAGNDTTHSAIPGGMLALLDHPDQLARLRADLTLLPNAIEEMLRFAPPVIHFRRTATADTALGGQRIRTGDKVVVFYPAANRDPAVFDDPDRFDIDRDPNTHLTFGIGPHFCLGNALARMQLRVLFTEVLTRLDDLQLDGPVERLRSNFINGIKHMPVRFAPAPRTGGQQ